MHKVDEVIERLRVCANGLGSFKDERGDFGLCDTAADLLAVFKEALEPFAKVAYDIITNRGDDEVIDDTLAADRLTWGDLRRARNALNGEKNG